MTKTEYWAVSMCLIACCFSYQAGQIDGRSGLKDSERQNTALKQQVRKLDREQRVSEADFLTAIDLSLHGRHKAVVPKKPRSMLLAASRPRY